MQLGAFKIQRLLHTKPQNPKTPIILTINKCNNKRRKEMGCNLSQLKKMKNAASEEQSNKKVLFLGLDNAGKSTLLF